MQETFDDTAKGRVKTLTAVMILTTLACEIEVNTHTMQSRLCLFAGLLFPIFLPAQNLVAYYPFSGNANDASGHNINPTYIGSGVSPTTDRFGVPSSAYYFNGSFGADGNSTGAFIRYPADQLPTTNRTISFWFLADMVSNYPTPFSYGGNNCNASCFLMIINKGNSSTYIAEGHCNAATIAASYSIAPVQVWKHWVYTTNGSTQKIFIDGTLVQTANNYTGPTYVSNKNMLIGALLYPDGTTAYEDNGAKTFKGKLDDIRIYDGALTDEQVLALHKLEKNSLVASYPFNGNANELTGNAATAAVNGAVLTTNRKGEASSAYQFNGSNSYLEVADTPALRLNNEITLAAWVKRTRLGIDIILEKGGDWTTGQCNYGLGLHHVNSNMFYFFFNGGWRGTSGVSDYEWHHYAAVARQGDNNPILYIDGEEKTIQYTSGGGAIQLPTSSHALHIGAQVGSYTYFGANVIDEIKIYRSALGPTAINALSRELVARYNMDGNCDDESGNGNNGVVYGATLTTDRVGYANKAYNFTNPNHIIVPNSNLFGDEFTLSYWFKIGSYFGQRGVLSNVAAPNGGFQQAFDGTSFSYILGYSFVGGYSPNHFYANYNMQQPVGQWHHLAMTYKKLSSSASETKLYINGELKRSDSHTMPITFTPGADFYIGQNHGGLNFQGDLDDIRIYNRVLAESELRSLIVTVFTFTGSGVWSNPANWQGGMAPPNPLPAGYEIVVNPPNDGECIIDIPLTLSTSSKLQVMAGKKLRVVVQ